VQQQSRVGVEALSLEQSFPILRAGQILGVTKFAGDASSREYFRVETRTNGSFVLQSSEAFDDQKASQHPFLSAQQILSDSHVPVPKVLGLNGVAGWILLEDLGDVTLQNQSSESLYSVAIESLLQWTLTITPQSSSKWPGAPHFGWAFDFEKLDFEMSWTQTHLFEGFLNQRNQGAVFRAATQENSRYLAQRPRFFCHRDFHCRNIMVLENSSIAVIDFQDARFGPVTYDLVSLLWDPYIQMSEPMRRRLLAQWSAELESKGVIRQLPGGTAELGVELERMKLQRCLKAAGSYASFYVKKKRKDYLPSLKPALAHSVSALENLQQNQCTSSQEDELLTLLQHSRDSVDRAILQA
jgi:aminoglycoside/choline kinase family phosphotransferase